MTSKLYVVLFCLLPALGLAQFQRVPADQVSVSRTNLGVLQGTNAQQLFESISTNLSPVITLGPYTNFTAGQVSNLTNNALADGGKPWTNSTSSTNLSTYNNDVPFVTGAVLRAESDPIWAGASNSVVYTNDNRLTNARVPLAHTQDWATITNVPTPPPPTNWSAYPAVSTVSMASKSINNASSVRFVPDLGWTQVSGGAPWGGRQLYRLQAYGTNFYMMGGSTSVVAYASNDVWTTSDGANWSLVTAQAAWTNRLLFGSAVLDGKMFIFGGQIPGTACTNDVWSSTNGLDWVFVTNAAWSGRSGFTVVQSSTNVIILGGANGPSRYTNDVWSTTNCADWTLVTNNASYSLRTSQGATWLNGRLWVYGGTVTTTTNYVNDVYYSDDGGANWTQTRNADWSNRSQFGYVAYSNRTYVLGGIYDTTTYLNDAWSTDNGSNWVQTTSAEWAPRRGFRAELFNLQLYMIGGYGLGAVTYSDMWRASEMNWALVLTNGTIGYSRNTQFYPVSTGAAVSVEVDPVFTNWLGTNTYLKGTNDLASTNWVLARGYITNAAPSALWSATYASNIYPLTVTWAPGLSVYRFYTAAAAYSNKLYICGGRDSTTTGAKTNVWAFDGTNYTEVAGLPVNPFGDGRYGAAAAIYSNQLYVVGGWGTNTSGGQATNIFVFNGTSWSTSSAALPFENTAYYVGAATLGSKLYMMGGLGTNNILVGSGMMFDGTAWTTNPASLPGGATRWAAAACTFRTNIYLMGGYSTIATGSGIATNVFKFDGSTWTEVAGLPLFSAYAGSCVINDRLYYMGGVAGSSTYRTNVYVFDGTAWAETNGLPVHQYAGSLDSVGGSGYYVGGRGPAVGLYVTNAYKITGAYGVYTNVQAIADVTLGYSNVVNALVATGQVVIGGVGRTNWPALDTGAGRLFVTEDGPTSILWHITSGGHTNKLMKAYSD